MKTRDCDLSPGILVRAIQLALLTMFALPGLAAAQDSNAAPQDPNAKENAAPNQAPEVTALGGDVKDLICPEDYFEIGAMHVPRTAPKFGEYNGLSSSGAYGLAGFSVSGGNGYCHKGGGTLRWDVYGSDLATSSRDLGLDVEGQGKWFIGLNFNQLRHYTTTGYQTPYEGGQGGNVFTLPAGFGTISSVAPSAAAPVASVNNLTAAQLAAFRTVNVYNERKNATFSAGFAFNTEWNLKFDYKRIDMSGAKLIGGGSERMTGAPGGLTWANEALGLKLNPNKFSTDMFTLATNWTGQNAYATFEYYASLFHDDYSGMSWANPFTAAASTTVPAPQRIVNGYPMDTLSTPPSNQFHQLNFSGGYFLSPATRLTGGLSFGVNTQNMSYDGTYTPGFATLPAGVNSLDGRVLTKHADAKLTHKFSPSLDFSAGFKYNERDNNTPVNTYQFVMLTGAAPTNNNLVNAPMSNRRTQFDANLDYRLDKNQKLHLGYEYDHMQRWCSNALANTGAVTVGAPKGYAPTSCAQVPSSTDNALTLSYKRVIMGDIDFSAGYTFADRRASINPWFYNPMQNFTQGFENFGWLAYFQAPRREHTLKTRLNWQANDRLSLGVTGQYTVDNYYDSTLGVQMGHAGTVNFDASYQVSDNVSLGAYLGWLQHSRSMISYNGRSPIAPAPNPAQAANYTWDNAMTDSGYSIGLNAKQKLLHGKLQLSEDLSYDFGKTGYTTNWLAGGPITAANLQQGAFGSTPDIKSGILQFRLLGRYDLDKHSRLTLGYMFQRLKSNDYLYAAYQYGFTAQSVLPNNMQEPTYTINTVFVVYRYTFR